MTAQEMANLVFGAIQEEMSESMASRWTLPVDGRGVREGRFTHNRIGNTLHVVDNLDKTSFEIQIKAVT
jgi:hypothetical protein